MNKFNFANMVYINIDVATERNQSMQNQIKKYNANISRYSGITDNFDNYSHDWSLLLTKKDPYVTDYDSKYLSVPEIGCLLSHLEVIRIYGEKDLVVFEDDVDLSTSDLWCFSLKDFVNKIPKNVNILQMVKGNKYSPGFVKKYMFDDSWGTGSYYISANLSKEIVEKYFVNGKWNISEMPCKWHRKAIDAVLYSFDNSYSCTLFSWLDQGSYISKRDSSIHIGTQILQYLNTLDLTLDFYFQNEEKINRKYWSAK